MTTEDDIEVLAGEYVLGTLDAAERSAVAARRQREAALDAAIKDWEQRLAPLGHETRAVAPPADLFQRIEQRIHAAQSASSAPSSSIVQASSNVVELAALRKSMARWRGLALAATAAAASLVMAIGLRETVYRSPEQTSFVAVFQKDDVLPAFYFTIDLKTREMTLRPVDAKRQPGMTYQLWIKDDALGPQPKSLGLVEANLAPTRKSLDAFDPSLLQRATFGVSLEPEGGSPTGLPSPGALHAKLLPATN